MSAQPSSPSFSGSSSSGPSGERPTQKALQTLNQRVVGCTRCPRLLAWRQEVARTKRRAYEDWTYWGKPVPGFGDPQARLLVVGLAPGAHGANRTGRVFTGDDSGDFLYPALYRAGFANQPESTARGDGLALIDAYITGVGRCVPPQNKPKAAELNACRTYLVEELQILPRIQAVLALGGVAFDHVQRAYQELGIPFAKLDFGHDVHYDLNQIVTVEEDGNSQNSSAQEGTLPHLFASYHPSRQNTRTGRLTEEMFDQVFGHIQTILGHSTE